MDQVSPAVDPDPVTQHQQQIFHDPTDRLFQHQYDGHDHERAQAPFNIDSNANHEPVADGLVRHATRP